MNRISRIEGGAKRLAEIVGVLTKYGLADWLNNVDADWIRKRLKSESGEKLTHRSSAERIRLALTELGPTAIKLGQMLSTRPDQIGRELADELAILQTSASPTDSFEKVEETIRGELGAPIEEFFESFSPEPIASGSIGQVHEATLVDSEQRVVVKLSHHAIEKRVMPDLDIIRVLADLMEKHAPFLRQYQPVATARLFKRTLLRELDLGYELRHIQEFTRNFADDETVHFPVAFPEISSRRVLTMEHLSGVSISKKKQLGEVEKEGLSEYARRVATMYLQMIFQDGFYHADPHSGNLMLLEDNVVGVLDCGMVGRIDEAMRGEVESLLLAAVTSDTAEVVEIVCRIGTVPPELDREDLRAELGELIADFRNQPLDNLDIGSALSRCVELIRRFHIVLPGGFALMLKTLAMLDGTLRKVTPSFSLIELLQPFYKDVLYRRITPKRALNEAVRTYRDWHRLFEYLPRDLRDIISRVRNGSFEVHLEHEKLEGTVDRLVKGLLASSLFIGSSMILSSKVPPAPGGLSILGLLGCVAAVVLALQLLRAIRKR